MTDYNFFLVLFQTKDIQRGVLSPHRKLKWYLSILLIRPMYAHRSCLTRIYHCCCFSCCLCCCWKLLNIKKSCKEWKAQTCLVTCQLWNHVTSLYAGIHASHTALLTFTPTYVKIRKERFTSIPLQRRGLKHHRIKMVGKRRDGFWANEISIYLFKNSAEI